MHAESRQLQWVKLSPTAVCSGSLQEAAHKQSVPNGTDAWASAVPAPGLRDAWRGQMESWSGCSVGTDSSATGWGGASGRGTKHDGGNTIGVPGKLIRAHLLGCSANRFLLCFPIALWIFFPSVCLLLPLSLPSCPYWSSGVSHFPPLHKAYAQEEASSAESYNTGAGGGQPELQSALEVTRDTKQG